MGARVYDYGLKVGWKVEGEGRNTGEAYEFGIRRKGRRGSI
jgi:hypothetical protein